VSSSSYVDFEITPRLLVMDTGERAIEVQLRIDHDYRDLAPAKSLTKEQWNSLSGELSAFSDHQARLIGEILMPSPILDQFKRLHRGSNKIRLAIKVPDKLLAVRWEAAYVDPWGRLAIAKNVSLIRRVKSRSAIEENLFLKRTKTFAVMDATHWTKDNDLLEIKSDCPSATWMDQFDGDCVRYPVVASYDGLDKYRESETPTAIFHFSGHGRPDGGVFIAPLTPGDDPGEWTSEDIRKQLAAHDVRLAVMSACRSGEAANRIFVGLSRNLAPVIPAVIGMQDQVRQETASMFTGAMYDRLAEGGDLEEAVFAGRRELAAPTGYDFAIPVLYLQVTGDTRMTRDGDEDEAPPESGDSVGAPRPVAAAAPTSRHAPPPLAVRLDEHMWWLIEAAGEVRLRDAGKLTEGGLYPPPSEAFGLHSVISADGQVVASKADDQVELRQIRVTGEGLVLGPPRLIELPAGLGNAQLLSVRVASGTDMLIVADDEHGTLALTVRGQRWSPAKRFAPVPAVAAVDTVDGVTIGLLSGGVERHDPAGSGFPGFAAVSGIDAASTDGTSVVLVSGVSAKGGAPRFRLERRTRAGSVEEDVTPATTGSEIVLVRDPSGGRAAVLSLDPQTGHVSVLEA
jgi:hypothetical protein